MRLRFVLQGTKSNRDAIGAKVEVDGQTKWLSAGSGFLSQHSKRLIFGLGADETAKSVRITWPSGTVQTLSSLASGQTHTITERQCLLRKQAVSFTAAVSGK